MTFYDHRYAYMRHLFANMNPRSFLLHIRNSYGIMQQRLREGRCMKKSRAATRTIKILEVISQAAKGLSLSEIAAALDMPITSVSDIVRALVEEEFIELRDERSKLYGIGVKAFFIGNAFISNTSLIDKARGVIENLAAETGRTVFLGKEVSGRITYIFKHEPKDPIIATCAIGSSTPLHCTSLGKSFLAFSPGLLESLATKSLTRKTPHTITEYCDLQRDIEVVRIRGFAVDRREQNDHLLCIGAPIFDSHHSVIAAVSVSGLYREDEQVDRIGDIVKTAAFSISRSMGYLAA